MQNKSVKRILDEIDAKELYLFNDSFFTGKLGYATTLILIGNTYNDSICYNRGGTILLEIIERLSLPTVTIKEKLILAYVLKFLELKGLIEIGVSISENLFKELLNDFEKDIFNYTNNHFYIFFLVLNINKDFKQALLNELVVRSCSLINSIDENFYSESNLNFLFFLDLSIKRGFINDELYTSILSEKIEVLKFLFVKSMKVSGCVSSGDLNLLKLYSIGILTEEEFLTKYRNDCIDYPLSQRIIYHIFFSSINLPFLSNDKTVILKSNNLGIVNGKLSLLYLNKKFVRDVELNIVNFILLFYNH